MKGFTPLIIIVALVLFARRRSEAPPSPEAEGGQGSGTPENPPESASERLEQWKRGICTVMLEKGPQIARNVERIYRLETGNFSSEGFRVTGTAGMKAANTTGFPWGWAKRGFNIDAFGPLWYAQDNLEGGAAVPWVTFRDAGDAAVYLGRFLDAYGNNPGRWNSTSPGAQATYNARVEAMPTPIVDSL